MDQGWRLVRELVEIKVSGKCFNDIRMVVTKFVLGCYLGNREEWRREEGHGE